jgi:glycosyl transferase, family 25
MKVFVLNLDRAKQRRAFMQAQLERLGLDYEFIRGTDYREMSEDDFRRLCSERALNKDAYLRGVFAASLSHLSMCRAIVDQGHSHGLILEDDVILPRNIEAILHDVERVQVADSVVLLRYYSHRSAPLLLTRRGGQICGMSGELLAPVEVDSVASAAAYVVTKTVAQRMLNTLCPVDHVPDNWGLFFKKSVFSTLYCLYPQIVKDAPFVPLVEYSATRTAAARLKAALRGLWGVNRLAALLRSESVTDQQRIALTDDFPFWSCSEECSNAAPN